MGWSLYALAQIIKVPLETLKEAMEVQFKI